MWFKIDNDILDMHGEKLGAYGLAVYMCLARFANAELVCWPAMTTIAKRTGMSRRQALKQINLLKDLNLIEVIPQYDPETKEYRSNLYKLIPQGGTAPHSVGGNAPRAVGTEPRADRKRPKKNYSPDNVKEERKNYRPAEYADVIL